MPFVQKVLPNLSLLCLGCTIFMCPNPMRIKFFSLSSCATLLIAVLFLSLSLSCAIFLFKTWAEITPLFLIILRMLKVTRMGELSY